MKCTLCRKDETKTNESIVCFSEEIAYHKSCFLYFGDPCKDERHFREHLWEILVVLYEQLAENKKRV